MCRLLLAAAAGSAATMLLSLLAWTLIARLPLVAAVGAWSGDDRYHNDPVPAPAAKASCVILALLACTVTVAAVRRLRALHHVRREGRQLGNGRLVVIDQRDLEAFAIPTGDEHHGRIVVSSGMLRTLTPEECRGRGRHHRRPAPHRPSPCPRRTGRPRSETPASPRPPYCASASAQLLNQARDHYHARPVRISAALRHEARYLIAVPDHRLHH